MRHRLIKAAAPSALALLLALGASGCGKKATPPTASQPAPEASARPAPQATQPGQATTQPATQQNGGPDLAEINRNLIRWIVGHKRSPNTFEEFAATAAAPIPPAPPGKKYVLANPPRIELVNQ
jgi:hypothetical protein